jgi:serine/threonine-protein kinase
MSAPLTEPSLLGSLLADRYEIRAPLGRGGMGEVYEAVDRRLGRTVAVKLLRPELADDERFLVRFRREASTAARLSHEGIVAVHDIGVAGGRTFIVMEFVAGSTLEDLARAGRRLDATEIARIGASAARALAHALDRGVMHRDVSPANVMVTTLGSVKILDFGIARAGSETGGGSALSRGTIAYVAPEVLRGGPVDARADVYALGSVLLHAAAGIDDRRLLDTLERATSPDPSKRYITATAFAVALQQAGVSHAIEPAAAATEPLPARGASRTAPIVPIATRPIATAAVAPVRHAPEPARGLAVRRGRRSGGARTARAVAASSGVVIALGAALVLGQAFTSMSEPQRARPAAPVPVPGPSGLVASASCDGLFSTGVELAWSGSPPVNGYEIWRGEGDGARTLVARVRGVHTEVFSDRALGIDASYTYRVRAYDGPRVSEWSNVAEVATPFLCLT